MEQIHLDEPALDITQKIYQKNKAGVRSSQCLLGGPINEAYLNKLRQYGYFTVERIATLTEKELSSVKGLSGQISEKITTKARAICTLDYKCTAWQLHNSQITSFHVSTGCDEIDKALGGGFPSKEVTEIAGESATGKSQFCDQICVNGQLETRCGRPGKIMWLDTERTFNAARLVRICDREGFDFQSICKNITLKRPLTEQQFDMLLNEALGEIDRDQANGARYSVLIVDSFIRPYRAQFEGMQHGQLAPRQQAIAGALDRLLRMAAAGDLVVVITNQVLASVDLGPMAKFAPKYKPAGGHVLAHAVNNRLTLRKSGKSKWILTTADVPHLPITDIEFRITETGIHDQSYDADLDKKIEHINDGYLTPAPVVAAESATSVSAASTVTTITTSSTITTTTTTVAKKTRGRPRNLQGRKRKTEDDEDGEEEGNPPNKLAKLEEELNVEESEPQNASDGLVLSGD